jgi:hypothetical protein
MVAVVELTCNPISSHPMLSFHLGEKEQGLGKGYQGKCLPVQPAREAFTSIKEAFSTTRIAFTATTKAVTTVEDALACARVASVTARATFTSARGCEMQ